MAQNELIALIPAFKDYIWGGTKIRDLLNKDTGDMQRIAESWEISTHPDGESTVADGPYAGKTLSEYFSAIGWEWAGAYGASRKRLPFMVKFIDAHSNLSVQVHPAEEYARLHENDSGKNEMWYIMDAEEDAFIYLGFNRGTDRAEVARRVAENTVEEILNKIPVRKGDSFYIPAGTVHAIGAGCLICEIQQTSNVTYRLYDYGRLGADGKPRSLHVEKALDVLDYHRKSVGRSGGNGPYRIGAPSENTLAATEWFTVTKFDMRDGENLPARGDAPAFRALLVVDGAGEVIGSDGPERLTAGSSRLLRQSAPISFCGRLSVLVVDF